VTTTADSSRYKEANAKHVTMRTSVKYLLLAASLVITVPASAQGDPSRQDYYRQWLRGQVEQWEQVETVTLREATRRTLDGPSGIQRVRLAADVIVYPGDRDMERTITAAEFNGNRVPEDRLDEFAGRWARFTRDLGREATSFADLRLRMLQATRPTGRPDLERQDGREVYRLDLISTVPRLRIDRITLWFDARDGSLVRSRTIFRPREERSTLIVENEYRRIGGLDVPTRRKIEATIQQKRRLRHFTTIVTVESQFEDFRIESAG
jgi:hypothetical protein